MIRIVMAAVLLACLSPTLAETSLAETQQTRATLFGVSTFPYGPSADAVEQTFRVAAELSDITVVQLDNGVPWREAMDNTDWPSAVDRKWTELRARAPAGRPVYLALEPLGADRATLAPAAEGSSVPRRLRGASFDDDALMQAYLTYAQRAVRFFHPLYVNLGVENGELAHRRPADWPAYARLIQHVMTALHAEFPAVRLGISFGLQSLLEPATLERARGLIEASDYVGLSFYPYMSSFHEKFGEPPLPPAPEQWRQPLDWIRAHTDKPIAICETGYNTGAVDLPRWAIRLQGSPELQAAYLQDLGRIAERDHYLFLVYYLPIDIGPSLDALPEAVREEGGMWRENGLLNAKLEAKPALAVWRSMLAARYEPPSLPGPALTVATNSPPPTQEDAAARIGFTRDNELCQAPEPARVRLVDTDHGDKAMLWEYPAHTGSWAWCARPFAPGSLPSGSGMAFRIRSDSDGPLILELKGSGGQGYYAIVQVGQSWRDVALDWRDFSAEGSSRQRPDLAQIVKIVIADEGKDNSASDPTRRVWISNWTIR